MAKKEKNWQKLGFRNFSHFLIAFRQWKGEPWKEIAPDYDTTEKA